MLRGAIIIAILVGTAIASQSPNWNSLLHDLQRDHNRTPAIKNRADLPLDPPVCPTNVGPYWLIQGTYSYQVAADACAAYGWRLAMLTRENSAQLSQLINACSAALTIIAGAHGLAGDPCAVATSFGQDTTAFQSLDISFCDFLAGSIICEEMPQVTVSQTETLFNLTITFGQTTTTTQSISTRTVRPYHPQCSDCDSSSSGSTYCDSSSGSTYCPSSSDSSCDWTSDSSSCSSSSSSSSDCGCPQRGRLRHKMLKPAALIDRGNGHCPHRNNTGPICYGQDCLPVCNATINGIHVITANVNYTDAAAECAKYGWSLLDFTTGLSDDVTTLFASCPEIALLTAGYVNSFNGVKPPCPFVQSTIAGDVLFSFSIVNVKGSEEGCALNPALPVYCQEHCPFQVAESGSETGQVSLTTDLTVTTATLFTPSTTVVIIQSCTESVFIN